MKPLAEQELPGLGATRWLAVMRGSDLERDATLADLSACLAALTEEQRALVIGELGLLHELNAARAFIDAWRADDTATGGVIDTYNKLDAFHRVDSRPDCEHGETVGLPCDECPGDVARQAEKP